VDFTFFTPWHRLLPRAAGHVVAVCGGRGRAELLAAVRDVYAGEDVAIVCTGPGDDDPGDACVVLADVAVPGDLPVFPPPPGLVWPERTSLAVVEVGGGAVGGFVGDVLDAAAAARAGLRPDEILTWEALGDLLLSPKLTARPAAPLVLAVTGLEDQPDSIGLFAFTARVMADPGLPVVLFGSRNDGGLSLRACCRVEKAAVRHLTVRGRSGIFMTRPRQPSGRFFTSPETAPTGGNPVHLTWQMQSVRPSCVALALVASLASAGVAAAACLPGQLQEANLAYQSAEEFLVQQQWDQAVARLQSIVNVCPEHVEATRGLGTAFMGKGQTAEGGGDKAGANQHYATAVDWFGKVIVNRGDNVEAGDYANLAKAYAKLKKFKEARAEYMKAEILAPDDCGVLFNLALLHTASGYHTQSVDVFEHLLSLDECERAHQQALQQIVKAAGKAADQQKKAGNNAMAAYYVELAGQYGGEAGGSTTMDLVRQKMNARDYAGAVELLEASLAKNPEQPNATLTLARALDAAGRKAESVDAYTKYLGLKPNDTTEWGTKLQVMVEAGQAVAAKSEAEKAYAEHRSKGRQALAPILYSWGLALEQTEEYETARARFAECAASGHAKYAAPAQTQVQRMDDLMKLEVAKRKKASQQGG
jgi:tetratricopeptide (TPR) repeat protein